MSNSIVVKVSGHELNEPEFLRSFALTIAALQTPTVIVHGGGKEISSLQQMMGIEPRYIDGVRVTDAQSLTLVEMVLCGTVNKRLVRHLVAAGVDALGVSGADRGLIRAEPMPHPTDPQGDLGFTGTVTDVRGDLIAEWLDAGITPVIAPICLGGDSNFNVNADHVAGEVAAAIDAEQLFFLSNVPGVMVGTAVVRLLTPEQVEQCIAEGIIFGGMIPKVKTALGTLKKGVQQAIITDLDGLKTGSGTVFTQTVLTSNNKK